MLCKACSAPFHVFFTLSGSRGHNKLVHVQSFLTAVAMTHQVITDTYKMRIIALFRDNEAFGNSDKYQGKDSKRYSAAMRSEMRCTASERIYNYVRWTVMQRLTENRIVVIL